MPTVRIPGGPAARGRCLGFDGRTVNAANGRDLAAALEGKASGLRARRGLGGQHLGGPAALSAEPVWALAEAVRRETAADKLRELREAWEEAGATVHVLTSGRHCVAPQHARE